MKVTCRKTLLSIVIGVPMDGMTLNMGTVRYAFAIFDGRTLLDLETL